VKTLALGGVTTYQTLGSVVIPMAGGEVSVSKRFGDARAFALGLTLGGAAVFPGSAGDSIDLKAVKIVSSDPVGFSGWGRLSATYFFTRYVGAGAFVGLEMALIGKDVLTVSSIDSSYLSDFSAVGGLQLVTNL
jgi:hypothetical protein